MSLTYLASPYTHPDPVVRMHRYWAAVEACARLMKDGEMVFAPIPFCHEVALIIGNPCDGEFWTKQLVPYLEIMTKLKVLRLDGWEQSKGVAHEIGVAQSKNIPVEYIDP